ncbi:fibroblast growth factor receptor substrate 2 [Dunckerocampus dactyliophorus]|uniref:fibroblast growth factor receptor substrate 2 n=1 Tax=Dunckerocampus dactyliophorus TaxID=161453 RepID=UPI0024069D33|nr:fibroblast growth factor receptor substrate 2 [Dunckerocampus dactyliophorus]XP_054641146.1 fibroblast growth factor receptor substrate 2 [Dunckerocampus dactyliophorus]
MGSCWSCLYRDPIRDNHLTKFKVINVDDEGNELGSGIMELTQTELILHTRKRDAIRWPYLCLRRYGYDSNLFSFESGRRCQTGQGIFAFKCSRAEEIFNLLQELMQCNSINVVEESMMMTRSGHTPEMEMSRTPQTPNTPAFPVQAFPNGYPGYPIRGESSQPSLAEEHGHNLMGLEDQTHTYVNTVTMEGDLAMRHCVHSLPEVRPSAFPETARGAMPGAGQGNTQSNLRCCPLEEHKDSQVFLQPSSQEVKFMLGPTPAQRHLLQRERERERERLAHGPHSLQPAEGATGSETDGDEPSVQMCNSLSYHHFHHHPHRHPCHEHPDSCQSAELTYENINGLRSCRKQRLSPSSVSQSVGSSSSSSTGDSHSHSLLHPHRTSSLPPQGYGCERTIGGGHRRTALLNYENLPSLPPVWEYSALQRDDEQEEEDDEADEEEYEEEEEDFDEYEFSEGPETTNGYHQDGRGIHRDALQNYVNTEQVQPPRLRHSCPPHPRPCQPDRGGRIFSFDFRRRSRSGVGACEHGHMPQSRQLNYIQVDLEGDALGGGGGGPPQHQRLPPKNCGPQAPRRSECYAVIDLKKTAAMSNLQKALPRDDGTSRKTRHNSTDLPL